MTLEIRFLQKFVSTYVDYRFGIFRSYGRMDTASLMSRMAFSYPGWYPFNTSECVFRVRSFGIGYHRYSLQIESR